MNDLLSRGTVLKSMSTTSLLAEFPTVRLTQAGGDISLSTQKVLAAALLHRTDLLLYSKHWS